MIRRWLIAIVAALLVPAVVGPSAMASSASSGTEFTDGLDSVVGAQDLAQKAAQVEDDSKVLADGQRRKWIARSDQAIRSGDVNLHGSGDVQIYAPGTEVREFAQGYMVQYQITGMDVVKPSTLTVFLDHKGEVLSSTQILLRSIGLESSGRMSMWVDNEGVRDVIVDDNGGQQAYTAQNAAEKDEIISPQWSFSKFKDCLNRQGVSAWVVTSISIACSVICAVTFGAGCAACIAAAGSIASTTIFYCARTS